MKNRKLFLLIGQSNMAGRGNLYDVPPIINRQCSVLRNGRWQPMSEPLCVDRIIDNRVEGVRSGIGPGASFADEYTKTHPDDYVCLIPCADGGTTLAEWQEGEVLFENAVLQTRLAMKSATLAGILWHQGESDSNDLSKATTYKERLCTMINALRRRLDAQNVPFVLGEVGEFINHAGAFPHVKVVNDASRAVATELGCGFVSVDGLSHKSDYLHFDAVAQRELGIRYCNELIRLENTSKQGE